MKSGALWPIGNGSRGNQENISGPNYREFVGISILRPHLKNQQSFAQEAGSIGLTYDSFVLHK